MNHILHLEPRRTTLPSLTIASDAPICIRQARAADVTPICQLVNYYAAQEVMLPKNEPAVYNSLFAFVVADADGHLAGCAALKLIHDHPAEIVSLAVRPEFQRRQVGRQLVQTLLDRARELGVPTVFALTLRPAFFEKLGFHQVHKSALPYKVWNDCSSCPKRERCDEIAVLRNL